MGKQRATKILKCNHVYDQNMCFVAFQLHIMVAVFQASIVK